MKRLLPLLTLLTLISCKEDKTPVLVKPIVTADTIKAESKMYHPVIMDKSLYSKEFVEAAEKYEYTSPMKIVGNTIELEGQVLEFESEIEMNKEYLFTAERENVLYELTLKRYTSVDILFEYKLTVNGNSTVYKGNVYMGLGFWLGSESTDDDTTGDLFLYSVYNGITDDGLCSVYIGIGDPDDENRIRTIFEVHCENETQNKYISEDVTLREHIE